MNYTYLNNSCSDSHTDSMNNMDTMVDHSLGHKHKDSIHYSMGSHSMQVDDTHHIHSSQTHPISNLSCHLVQVLLTVLRVMDSCHLESQEEHRVSQCLLDAPSNCLSQIQHLLYCAGLLKCIEKRV